MTRHFRNSDRAVGFELLLSTWSPRPRDPQAYRSVNIEWHWFPGETAVGWWFIEGEWRKMPPELADMIRPSDAWFQEWEAAE